MARKDTVIGTKYDVMLSAHYGTDETGSLQTVT